ncbi:hypothetical protein CR513_12256, partial [Mucuna pruriens]
MPVTRNQAGSNSGNEDGDLQERSEEHARLTEETRKRQEEAEKLHEEEIRTPILAQIKELVVDYSTAHKIHVFTCRLSRRRCISMTGMIFSVTSYFRARSKWIEVKLVATILVERVRRFYWRRIIYCFGLPAVIISDNGTQFALWAVAKFCAQYGIKQSFTSMEHPRATDKRKPTIELSLKDYVLWSYHTTTHSTTQETPFCLTFGTNPMIPVEVEESSPCIVFTQCDGNEEELRENLDLL